MNCRPFPPEAIAQANVETSKNKSDDTDVAPNPSSLIIVGEFRLRNATANGFGDKLLRDDTYNQAC